MRKDAAYESNKNRQIYCRVQKKANLTQAQLAEKLGITDKAISSGTGMAMPDTSIMLELCDILCISVNELLSGEKIDAENNNRKNEQLLLDMAKELEKDKTIWSSMWMILSISFIFLFGGLAVSVF